jgi:hypothetical protein
VRWVRDIELCDVVGSVVHCLAYSVLHSKNNQPMESSS